MLSFHELLQRGGKEKEEAVGYKQIPRGNILMPNDRSLQHM